MIESLKRGAVVETSSETMSLERMVVVIGNLSDAEGLRDDPNPNPNPNPDPQQTALPCYPMVGHRRYVLRD
jgi:hypothetical protein